MNQSDKEQLERLAEYHRISGSILADIQAGKVSFTEGSQELDRLYEEANTEPPLLERVINEDGEYISEAVVEESFTPEPLPRPIETPRTHTGIKTKVIKGSHSGKIGFIERVDTIGDEEDGTQNRYRIQFEESSGGYYYLTLPETVLQPYIETDQTLLERVTENEGRYLTEGPINVPKDTLQIIPWGHFAKQWLRFGLKSSHFKKYKKRLKNNPAKGWAPPKGSEGLSVSDCWVSEITIPQGNVIRVVYTYIEAVNRIFCLMVYSHITINGIRGKKDLTKSDKIILNEYIAGLKEKYPKGGK